MLDNSSYSYLLHTSSYIIHSTNYLPQFLHLVGTVLPSRNQSSNLLNSSKPEWATRV